MAQPTAVVSPEASIGARTIVWEFAQVREHAVIGTDCVISNGVYIDANVVVGNHVTIHNKSSLYRLLTIEDDVFIGPHVCFTNDKHPASGRIRELTGTGSVVRRGATIGAHATILPDIIIGRYAFVGAGSVVTRHVGDHQLVYGNPAAPQGYVCYCRRKAMVKRRGPAEILLHCSACQVDIVAPTTIA